MVNKILGFISTFVGIIFVMAILLLAFFNKYNIPFLDYLEKNHQILTNGFILIAVGAYLSHIENQQQGE